jgi:Nucleotidyl transferase AbiEii toxin, Type IV TA system
VTVPDLVQLFIEPLETLGLRYFVTGGVATIVYGDPRFTRDIDIVLALDHADIAGLRSSFDPAQFYIPPEETMVEEATRQDGGHFNIIHTGTLLRADVYLTGRDPLHSWAFENRRRLVTDSVDLWVAPVEYVILRKLEYYKMSGSERHLRDVAAILNISANVIDQAMLDSWLNDRNLRTTLNEAEQFED